MVRSLETRLLGFLAFAVELAIGAADAYRRRAR